MEMQLATSRTDVPEDDDFLSFRWLYQRVEDYAAHSIYPKASSVERWSYGVGLLAAVIGLLGALIFNLLFQDDVTIWFVALCLLLEIGGLLSGSFLTIRREFRGFTQPRLSHAKEMDADFGHWKSLVQQLRGFPREQREERLRFVSSLRSNMIERMGIMYGGLQRLGPFPLLVALYFQFRNWKWGDWAALFDVNLLAGLLIATLITLYLLGWVLIGQRIRLDTYVNLLEASLQPDAARATNDVPR